MKNILFVIAILIVVACDNGGKTNNRRTYSNKTTSSAPYELLVVANKEWLKTPPGMTLTDVVTSEIPGLPQVEPSFRMTAINPASFNNTFKVYANIITAEVNKKYTTPELKIVRDIYARPQIIMTIYAPDNASFVKLINDNKENILAVFTDAELAREREYLKRVHSGKVLAQAKKQFGCTIYAPKDISAIKTGKDFFWASSDGRDNKLNVCIYSYPYTSTETFTLEYFLQKRDSFMMENIRGAHENQYMSTDHRAVMSRNMEFDGRFVQEVRGLWQMENDMMGGPFVSYAQVDTVNNRVIVTEGFVYAPEKNKREFIREMEAAVQTLVLPH